MKKQLKFWVTLSVLTIPFASQNTLAQTNFIDGQIITINGDTLTGLINFQDWSISPNDIYFKRSTAAEEDFYTPADIIFFEVAGYRYISALVDIDQTPLKISSLAGASSPSSTKKRVFLKVLIDGDSMPLYMYRDFREHFYFLTEDGIEELISNQYYTVRENKRVLVRRNEILYQVQLREAYPQCSELISDRTSYKESDLKKFMLECIGLLGVGEPNYIHTAKRAKVKVGVYGGFASSALSYKTQQLLFGKDTRTIDLTGYAFGFLIKIIPPSNLSRGSVSMAIESSKYTSEEEGFEEINGLSFKVWHSYKLLNKSNSPFIDTGLSFSRKLKGSTDPEFDPDVFLTPGVYVGLGYEYETINLTAYFNFNSSREEEFQQKTFGIALGLNF